MESLTKTFQDWRNDLTELLRWIQHRQKELRFFFLKLYGFFFLLNFGCYWLGMVLIFPRHVFGPPFLHYFKISLPVGVMGALFDSLSFYVTLWIIQHALNTSSKLSYTLHLCLDFIIAILATFWVLFVFVISGWIVNQLEGKSYSHREDGSIYVVESKQVEQGEQFKKRSNLYRARVEEAMEKPLRNWRNILFGIIMGLSAMLPTSIHMLMFFRHLFGFKKPLVSD